MADPSLSLPVQTVAILGAGTMGHGIAQVCAMAGARARIFDSAAEAAHAAPDRIRHNLEQGVARGKLGPEARDSAMARISAHVDLGEALEGAELVVEAVPERLELKQQLLGQCAERLPDTAILASNTSSLSIAAIASAIPRPERVIGLHFFNPVHLMKLLEIVVGERTAAEVVETCRRLGTAIGKECIVVRDSPGFATSRLGLVIGLEAIRMVEEGVASAEDIDKAMTLGYGFPMGPLRLTDLVGLDVRLSIAEYLSRRLPLGGHFEPPALLRRMVAEGKLGKKTGRGFYEWS